MGRLGIDWEGLRGFLHKVNDRYPLERIILFGSRARGDEIEESDYDLILVSPKFEGANFAKRLSDVLVFWNLPESLEVLCYTPEEYEKKSSEISVVSEAAREGVSVTLGKPDAVDG